MINLSLTQAPVANTGMLIRKPVAEVYQAFIDPAITTKFWFTKSSGILEAGKIIRWEWGMYGASTEVNVINLEQDKRILTEWGDSDTKTRVEYSFTSRAGKNTFVSITESGFSGGGGKVMEQAMDSSSGFSLVLANLKAYLEHGITLNLIADRFPDHLINQPLRDLSNEAKE